MRQRSSRLFVGLVVVALTPGLAAAAPATLEATLDILMLGAGGRGAGNLRTLAANNALSLTEIGELRLLEGALEEPLALFELADLPTDFLAKLTVHQIGPVVGPGVTEVPQNVTLGAVALAPDEAISAEMLRTFRLQASIRQETPAEQDADMAALLGELPTRRP